MSSSKQSLEPSPRQRWMSLLAKADTTDLEDAWTATDPKPEYSFLRKPETGLVMVRGRAGATGGRFNMGEMTVTRCTLCLEDGTAGHGYVVGRKARHAELAAAFDAILQIPTRRPDVERSLLDPLERKISDRRREQSVKTAATRVDFFTLVRGEDE